MSVKEKLCSARKAAVGFCSRHAVITRAIVLLVALLLSFFFIEYPFNTEFLSTIESFYPFIDLVIMAILFAVVYLLGQQSRISIVAFLAVCLLIGVADHYLMDFKGTPLIPSDIFAIGTALDVAGGYSLTPDPEVIIPLLTFVVFSVLLFVFVPKIKLSAKKAAIHTALAVVVGACGIWGFLNVDLRKTYDVYIYAFHLDQSYTKQGAPICLVAMGQTMLIREPEGYSAAEQEELAKAALEEYQAEHGESTDVQPTVICIMNESFMDLSIFDEVTGMAEVRPENLYNIAQNSIVSGYAYSSGYGASTCNSEFEFLTGSSMAYCGSGAYPYMYYDLENSGNLARYFKDLGYKTSAIHPAPANNWKRDRVYDALGFDDFYAIESFEGAEMIRDKTTDKETYKKALELLDSNEGPQFIFDVTYANHAGYQTHLIDESILVQAPIGGQEYDYVDEYLSVIMQADRDLRFFIDELQQRDEPIIVCFFGDHGPNFLNKVFGCIDDVKGSDRVNQSQKRYTVPYFIWANYDAQVPDLATNETAMLVQPATTAGYSTEPKQFGCMNSTNFSFGYLSTALIQTTGLPMDERTAYLAKIRDDLPLVNSIGFMDKDGLWHRHSEGYSDEMAAAMDEYKKFQYWNLFSQNKGK